jgi:hypothetical protein
MNCPTCRLPMESRNSDDTWQPNCNSIRSPGCWHLVGVLPKHDSSEAKIIAAAKNRGQG